MKKIILLVTFIVCNLLLEAQYVRLQGKQFYNGNDPFYPVVMNYAVTIQKYTSGGTTTFMVAPDPGYGANPTAFEHNTISECDDDLLKDFQKCIDMGFNCIRTFVGAPVFFNNYDYTTKPWEVFLPDLNSSTPIASPYTGLAFLTYDNDPALPNQKFYQMDPTTSGDPNTDIDINLIAHLLDLADYKGIKVILVCGLRDIWYSQNTTNIYSSYLAKLATALQNKPALMAYDLVNEPTYQDALNNNLKKHDVCEYTKQWYDAIKDNQATNHLVTMGVGDLTTIALWDPGVMKLDFFSPHIYPYERDYETANTMATAARPRGYSRTEAYERWQSQIYWLSENMPTPWLIGETGFPAQDDLTCTCWNATCATGSCDPGDACIYNQPPYQFGCEDEARIFAHNSQQYVWDCGGSGYSWWTFQNIYSIAYNAEDPLTKAPLPLAARENYFGMLYRGYGYPYSSAAAKPAAQEFDNTYPHPYDQPRNSPTAPPPNYYDPYHNTVYSSAPSGQHISSSVPNTLGYLPVTDFHTGLPIKNAIINGETYCGKDNLNLAIYNSFQTFTDQNGNFNLVPFDYKNPTNATKQYIQAIYYYALGSEYKWYDDRGVILSNVDILDPNFFKLKKVSTNVNETVENVTIHNGESFRGVGLKTLTVSPGSNSVIIESGGTANFKAMDEVQVEGGFHAESGSEVHLFTDTVNISCSDIIDANPPNGFRYGNVINESTNSLELVFKKGNALVSVYPNPSAGYFTVLYHGNSANSKDIKVYDTIGDLILSMSLLENSSVIDLSGYPKGIYMMQFNDKSTIFNQKIILQ